MNFIGIGELLIMKKEISPIEMYLKLMYEFRERTIAVGLMCNDMYRVKKSGNVFEIENICLQMRKLLELIAMSSLVMNRKAFEKAEKSFQTMWNAKLILKDIKHIHPQFFPMSISGTLSKDENGCWVMDEITHEPLAEETFCKIYDKCGAALHIQNPFSENKQLFNELWDKIPIWLDKIYLTMEKHMVFLYGTDLAYAVQFNGLSTDKNITYTLCKKK